MVEGTCHEEFHEFFGNHTFSVEIHRQIGIFPFAVDPQTLEFLALNIDPAFGKLAAFLTEIDDVNFVLVFAFGAILFFDLPFDWQTVTIPTGDIARVAA